MATKPAVPQIDKKPATATSFPPKEEAKTNPPAPAKAAETGQEKFVRLAKDRMPKALKRIEMVANLASYDWTEKQKDKILADLQTAVDKVKDRFRITAGSEKPEAEEYDI